MGRARAIQGVFEPVDREVLDLVESDGKVAVAFRLGGRRLARCPPAGGSRPSGQPVTMRIIDILTLTDGLISNIWTVADELGALVAIDPSPSALARAGTSGRAVEASTQRGLDHLRRWPPGRRDLLTRLSQSTLRRLPRPAGGC